MIGFEPNEDQKLMLGQVAQLAKSVLRERQREVERLRGVPEDIRASAHEMGLGMVAIPEECGGHGLGMTTAVLLEEEIAYGDPAAAFALGGPGSLGLALAEIAPKEAKKYLEGFTHDRFGAVAWGEKKPTTVKDGALHGEKHYVINADRADTFLVFAEGGAFVVKRGAKGLTVLPRATTLGLDAASFGGIRLEAVVPEARFDAPPDKVIRFFARQSLLFAARGVGLSRAAFEITRDYCEQRKAFGKPIGHFQAVAFTLADRLMDLEAARALVWKAANAWDQKGDGLLESAWAISWTHEAVMRAGDDAVQLHGGSGFMRDYPVEKMMRDAKQLMLCGMTASHADQLAAAVLLGTEPDPALVLPGAESQNAFV
jgi:alkylation response protein AidB-like acyl-CoA dehydrogenase